MGCESSRPKWIQYGTSRSLGLSLSEKHPMLRCLEHHETIFQPDSPKPAAKCVVYPDALFAMSEVAMSCAVTYCRASKGELSRTEELDQEGPNNIARDCAQMTRRFGNAEKDPCRQPQTFVRSAARTVLP
jgi:hypothetical protein